MTTKKAKMTEKSIFEEAVARREKEKHVVVDKVKGRGFLLPWDSDDLMAYSYIIGEVSNRSEYLGASFNLHDGTNTAQVYFSCDFGDPWDEPKEELQRRNEDMLAAVHEFADAANAFREQFVKAYEALEIVSKVKDGE